MMPQVDLGERVVKALQLALLENLEPMLTVSRDAESAVSE